MNSNIINVLNYVEKTLHTPIRHYKNGIFEGYWQHAPHTDPLLKYQTKLIQHFTKKKQNFPIVFFLNDQNLISAISEGETTFLIGPIKIATTIFTQFKLINELTTICEILCLLQNIMSDTNLLATDVIKYNGLHHNQLKKKDQQMTRNLFEIQEDEFMHNPYDQEVRELQSITDGDIKKLYDSLHETFEGRFPVLGSTKLRSLKNLAIVDLGLIARAAIKGGMDYEQAFSLNDQCIRVVEDLSTESEIQAFGLHVKEQYTKLVHESRSTDLHQNNLLIKRCKKYIQTHLHNQLSLTELAQYCHVSNQYLSKIFHRVCHQTLVEYIHYEKVQAAKRDLIYTNNKISAIASDYGFNSASHFGVIFKKNTATTPTKFRMIYEKV